MLQAIAALKFAQGATIDENSFCSTCGISASTCLPFNSNLYGSSILQVHSYRVLRVVQLFQAESCCSHRLCPSCSDGNLLVDTFCVQKIIEQENLIKQNHISASKYCVWKHRSWRCEKSACRCWTEQGILWVSITFHSLFPCFCQCIRIDIYLDLNNSEPKIFLNIALRQ